MTNLWIATATTTTSITAVTNHHTLTHTEKKKIAPIVVLGKAVGFYHYHTPDTRPHKIMPFGLYKMGKNELMDKSKQSGSALWTN